MYNSQYYTCEQIDERLLQGYLDDYNNENHTSLTKSQFLSILGNILNLLNDIGIDDEPTPESNNFVKSGGVSKFYGNYVSNPEYIEAKTDNSGRLIEAIKKNGKKVINDAEIVNLDFGGEAVEYSTDNPEFNIVIIDSQGHVLAGIKKGGEFWWSNGIPEHLKEYVTGLLKPVKSEVDEMKKELLGLTDLADVFIDTDVIYKNPVTDFYEVTDVHPDVTIFKYNDIYYMFFSTIISEFAPLLYSYDLTSWQECESSLLSYAVAEKLIEMNGGEDIAIWAPQIVSVGNKWNFYGSLGNERGMFVLTSDNPTSGFDFVGEPEFLMTPEDVGIAYDVIDPCFASDNGNNYLFFGSACGVFRVMLSQDGLSVIGNYERVLGVADQSTVDYGNFEGVMLYKRGDYWYMFASPRLDYRVLCWRSTTLNGTFVNKQGTAATSGVYGELVCEGNNVFQTCGHISDIIEVNGRTYATCNARVGDYARKQVYGNRQQVLFEIFWDADGWPYTKDNTIKIYNSKSGLNNN